MFLSEPLYIYPTCCPGTTSNVLAAKSAADFVAVRLGKVMATRPL